MHRGRSWRSIALLSLQLYQSSPQPLMYAIIPPPLSNLLPIVIHPFSPPTSQNPIPLPLQSLYPFVIPIIQVLRRQPIILLIYIKRLPPFDPLQPQLLIF